jgi:amino acid adenylation domain-containing protein
VRIIHRELKEERDYWLARLSHEAVASGLKLDSARPTLYAAEKDVVGVVLPEHVSLKLLKLTGDSPFLLFTLLVAGLKVCLHKHTGNDLIAVGTPARRRGNEQGAPVNALVIVDAVGGAQTFRDLLTEVRETLTQAYTKQNYPFERLVRELGLEGVANKCPLFDVALVLEEIHGELPELRNDITFTFRKISGGVSGQAEFNRSLFRRDTIERFVGHFIQALDNSLANVNAPIRDVEVLAEAERRQLLVDWNDTSTPQPPGRLIHELFEAQVERAPYAIAVVDNGEQVSYSELNERANRLARHLRSLGVGPEVLVGVLMERSVELVVALLGVLKAGGAYVPLDPSYPAERLAFMSDDAGLSVLLTVGKLAGLLPASGARLIRLDELWEEISALVGSDLPATADEQNVAYAIYTSGSTGRPKGVLVPHRGLCNMVEAQARAFDVRPHSRVLQFAAFGFDASVSEVFMALTTGAALYLWKSQVLSSPTALAGLMREESITTVTLPPAMLAALPGAELPELQTLIAAGESCSAEIVARWSPPRRFFNAYGPTETTVCATMHQCAGQYDAAPPIGRPIDNMRVYILDPHLRPVPVGVTGELYVAGVGVARGYLRRPELTGERFIPDPFGGAQGARLYRTGDLARYRADGEIEFLGRRDQQVKVRGYRIELGEVESVLGAHPGVRAAVVTVREDRPGDRRLTAYVVGAEGAAATAGGLAEYLREKLPEYMIPSAFVALDALPLTPNGKVDRRALPPPGHLRPGSGESYVAPRTPIEELLANIWSEVLAVERVGVDDNFFALGGHSLLATQVVSRIKETLHADIGLDALFEAPTVADLAHVIKAARGSSPKSTEAIPRAPRGGDLPLSFSQQRLWFIAQLESGNPFYNISSAVRLKGILNVGALERTLNEIVQRHETLRTAFTTTDGQPVQVIAPEMKLSLKVSDLRGRAPEEREDAARREAVEESKRPFDLSRGPLLRAVLLRLDDEEHIAVLTMHHIVSDGWSMGVLIHEVSTCYEAFSTGKAPRLPELPIQYADFAVWQREQLRGEALEEHLSYWRRKLADLPMLALPTDHPRPAIQSVRGAYHQAPLPSSTASALRALSQEEGVSIFMTLLTAFQALLSRYTGQQDIVVGTDVANRNRVETEGLIGIFLNHLVLRTDLSGWPTFRELLGRVRETSLGAYAHQDLPFDVLVKALKPKRDLSHTPLFQVLFVVQNAPMPELRLTGLTLSVVGADNETTKFDFSLFVIESGEDLIGVWKYNSDLFEPSTIARIAGHFETLLNRVVARPEARLEELLEQLDWDEKRQPSADKEERQRAKLKKLATAKRRTIDLGEVKLVETSELRPGHPLPLLVRPTSPDFDHIGWARAHAPFLSDSLARHAGLLFRGFPLHSASDFERFASALCPDLYGEYGDLPRRHEGGKVYGATPYPADRPILFHNESSHLERWPMKIMFFCAKPAARGGATPAADCREVWRGLDAGVRERLRREGLLYVRNYAPGLDVSWQGFFRTTQRSEVERRCEEAGAQWEWLSGDVLRVKQRRQAVALHPETGEEVFFNQVQLHHASSLDAEVRKSLLEVFGEEGLPRNVYYGDGSVIPDEVMAEVGRTYEAVAVDAGWEQGDVLMLDNMLAAHGRRAYEGEREIVVAMGQMMEARGVVTEW